MRAGENKTGRPLLQEQFLQWGELVQNGIANRIGQLPEKAFEAFDDMEEHGVVHRVRPT